MNGRDEPLYAISYNGPYVTSDNRTDDSGRQLTILLPESEARQVWGYVRREGKRMGEANVLLGLWRRILDKREGLTGVQQFVRPDECTVRVIEKNGFGIGKPDVDEIKKYAPDHALEGLERVHGSKARDWRERIKPW